MKRLFLLFVLISMIVAPAVFAADATGVNMKPKTADEWQKYLRYRRDAALEELYKMRPEAKGQINAAQGYAVFSNFGMKIMFVGTGSGRGILHDNKTGKDTFMRMAQVGAGFGFGVKDFRVIFIFDDRKVMEEFITSGWDFGGQANASAKSDQGAGAAAAGAATVVPGMRVYQLTENGLSAEAMVNGTKYWVDKEVNK